MLNYKARHSTLGQTHHRMANQEIPAARPVSTGAGTARGKRVGQYWALTKPGVSRLAVFCAVIGMFLATDGLPDWRTLAWASIGIWLLAGAAFAVNCLIEAEVDARMDRTARRATAMGELTGSEVGFYSAAVGSAGALVLYTHVNPLTMWLTLATFVGYALIYTMFLKPYTSQNIVIGDLAGAMPPALGWAAVANEVPLQAWLLVLIIFMWTPPHFWVLAMYRREDYARSGLPMLPVTRGLKHTGLQVWLYTIGLAGVTALPWAVGMSGWPYLVAAMSLNVVFIRYGWKLYRHYSDQLARQTFIWSLVYLSLLFAALLADHYCRF
jgi:protoheme IX farnesyltransferase